MDILLLLLVLLLAGAIGHSIADVRAPRNAMSFESFLRWKDGNGHGQ